MDYKKNYIKYKNKYLNLKQKNGGDPKLFLSDKDLENFSEEDIIYLPDNFLELLKKEYSTIKFDTRNQREKYTNSNITYGEMTYEGMEMLLNHLHTNHQISFKNFIDLGSGRGKLPLQVAALQNVEKSIGIELVKERHDDAEEIKDKLKKYKSIINKVEFINDDFNNINLDNIDDVTLVWISNKCFSQELTDKIFNKLITLPKGSIITCSNKVNNINTNKIKKIDNLKVPNSDVYFYIIK